MSVIKLHNIIQSYDDNKILHNINCTNDLCLQFKMLLD